MKILLRRPEAIGGAGGVPGALGNPGQLDVRNAGDDASFVQQGDACLQHFASGRGGHGGKTVTIGRRSVKVE